MNNSRAASTMKAASWILSAGMVMGCVGQQVTPVQGISYRLAAAGAADPLSSYPLTGDTHPVLDPSIIKVGGTYYLFSTDVNGPGQGGNLGIRCSADEMRWAGCGSVFQDIPAWVRRAVPGIAGLWAPDVTYWGGLYRVYYSGSTLGSQRSVIGVATNVTLDRSDPRYRWVDQGQVLGSVPGDDFNAIDPNILVDIDGRVWLNYGSYWSGIKQVELDATTGGVKADAAMYELATRPGVENNPIEGASMVRHNGFYYLFVSVDYCCRATAALDDYKEAFGRSASPHGPFLDVNGIEMNRGGGTVILYEHGTWNAAGGGTAYVSPETGESVLAFHALKMNEGAMQYGWVKHLGWQDDWPVLE